MTQRFVDDFTTAALKMTGLGVAAFVLTACDPHKEERAALELRQGEIQKIVNSDVCKGFYGSKGGTITLKKTWEVSHFNTIFVSGRHETQCGMNRDSSCQQVFIPGGLVPTVSNSRHEEQYEAGYVTRPRIPAAAYKNTDTKNRKGYDQYVQMKMLGMVFDTNPGYNIYGSSAPQETRLEPIAPRTDTPASAHCVTALQSAFLDIPNVSLIEAGFMQNPAHITGKVFAASENFFITQGNITLTIHDNKASKPPILADSPLMNLKVQVSYSPYGTSTVKALELRKAPTMPAR